MNTTETNVVHAPLSESLLSEIAIGSTTEGIGAIGAIVLAIIGLAGVFPNVMAAIATIVIGAVILVEGGAIGVAGRWLVYQNVTEGRSFPLSGGITAEFFGGLAGVVLGILALFRATPDILLAAAVLIYGAALLVGGATLSRGNLFLQTQSQSVTPEFRSLAGTGAGGYILVGMGTLVLGILAVIGQVPMTLILVGLLSLGACALFSGANVNRLVVK